MNIKQIISFGEGRVKMDGKKPVYSIKVGAIDGAIWENKTETGLFHTISIIRNYLDKNEQEVGKEGTWKTTNSFTVADLPNVQIVCQKCYEYIKIRKEGGL